MEKNIIFVIKKNSGDEFIFLLNIGIIVLISVVKYYIKLYYKI